MRRVPVVLACALIAAGCSSGPPNGGPPGGPGGPGGPAASRLGEAKIARPVAILLTGLDANHDLLISNAELAEGLKAEFARADADGNGSISAFEMVDWNKLVLGDGEAQPDRRAMDSDLGGSVSRSEFDIALRKEFVLADANGDGSLTRAELLHEAPRMAGMGGGGGQSGGRPPGGGGRGRGPGGGGGRPPG